jgi:hypothetical protein
MVDQLDDELRALAPRTAAGQLSLYHENKKTVTFAATSSKDVSSQSGTIATEPRSSAIPPTHPGQLLIQDITEHTSTDDLELQSSQSTSTEYASRPFAVRYLEVCVNYGMYESRHVEVNVSHSTSDHDFFERLRKEYIKLRGRQNLFLPPSGVRFVEVCRQLLLLQTSADE